MDINHINPYMVTYDEKYNITIFHTQHRYHCTCDAVVLTVHKLTCFQPDNLFKSTNELLLWKLSAIKKQK